MNKRQKRTTIISAGFAACRLGDFVNGYIYCKITCNIEKIVYFQRTYISIFVDHFMKKACTSWGMYDTH